MSDLVDGLEAGVSVRSSSGLAHKFILKTSSVEGGRFLPEESKSIIEADLHRARCHPVANSMIISRMNTPALVGNVGYVSKTYKELFLPDRLWIARPKRGSGTDMRWLTYYFASKPGTDQLQALATGTSGSMKNIAKGRVLDLEISVPDPYEQHMISEVLSDIDGLLLSLERLVEKKQAVKRGMMQHLLTGRTRLPGFEEEWVVAHLRDIARFGKGSGLPKAALTPVGATPCIHYGELFTLYGAEISEIKSRTNTRGNFVYSEKRDVLMPTSDVTPDGLAKASCIHLQGVALGGDILVIRPDRSRLYGPFLAHLIRYEIDQVLRLVTGSTVYHLYASDMQNFETRLPPVEEQQAIVYALRGVEEEIDLLHQKLDKTRAIKIGMMQQLLTGCARLPIDVTA